MYVMTTQKAMQMYETLNKKDRTLAYNHMAYLKKEEKREKISLTPLGLFGIFAMWVASIAKPSKGRYGEDEIDQLISDIRHGKA